MGLSVAAGLATVAGAALLFGRRSWNERNLAFFLGLAAGVMAAVVALNMMPSALLLYPVGPGLAGLALGLVLMGYYGRFARLEGGGGDTPLMRLGLLIMLGIALHDLPEGMAIALGEELKGRTGLVIALGVGVHNIPEGMVMAAPLLMAGMPRRQILGRCLLVALITPLGALLGAALLGVAPGIMPVMLGLASGIMAWLCLFQLWPQAVKRDGGRSRWGFLAGVAIIILATFL